MSYTYALTSGTLANSAQQVIRSDGAIIPPDAGNADFQAYLAWLAASNTPTPVPSPSALQLAEAQYGAALAAGLVVSWSTSTTLNATYALDQMTQFNITAEMVSINTNSTFANGQTTRNWPTTSGSFVSVTVAQFKLLATAIGAYVDNLVGAVQTAAAGGTPSWPSSSVTLNA